MGSVTREQFPVFVTCDACGEVHAVGECLPPIELVPLGLGQWVAHMLDDDGRWIRTHSFTGIWSETVAFDHARAFFARQAWS